MLLENERCPRPTTTLHHTTPRASQVRVAKEEGALLQVDIDLRSGEWRDAFPPPAKRRQGMPAAPAYTADLPAKRQSKAAKRL